MLKSPTKTTLPAPPSGAGGLKELNPDYALEKKCYF